jgi:hypothetical protein
VALLLQCSEIGEHVGRMCGHVGDHIRLADDAVRIDEERVALGVIGVLLAFGAADLVLRADGALDVAQQAVLEVLRLGEGEILRRSVERRAEDDAVGIGEAVGAVTQPLALNRSTRRRCFRVPPQQHPLAALVVQADLFTVLVREAEVRCGSTDLDGHGRTH